MSSGFESGRAEWLPPVLKLRCEEFVVARSQFVRVVGQTLHIGRRELGSPLNGVDPFEPHLLNEFPEFGTRLLVVIARLVSQKAVKVIEASRQ